MKIVKTSEKEYIPASHEDPSDPGVMKKVLAVCSDFEASKLQMINWACMKPAKNFEPHYHEDMEEVFIIIQGEAEITVNKETSQLSIGDAVFIPARAVHKMSNTGRSDLVYIAVGVSKGEGGRTVNV